MIQTMWGATAMPTMAKKNGLVKNDYVTVTFRPKSSGPHNLIFWRHSLRQNWSGPTGSKWSHVLQADALASPTMQLAPWTMLQQGTPQLGLKSKKRLALAGAWCLNLAISCFIFDKVARYGWRYPVPFEDPGCGKPCVLVLQNNDSCIVESNLRFSSVQPSTRLPRCFRFSTSTPFTFFTWPCDIRQLDYSGHMPDSLGSG